MEPVSDLLIPTGEFIREEMAARGWSDDDLGARMRVSGMIVSMLIDGTEKITPAYAKRLARAFGTSPDYWLNLERRYRAGIVGKE